MRLDEIAAKIIEVSPGRPRTLIGIAGPPGAGKSTLAEALCKLLKAQGQAAKTVPMDGFHLDNAVLDQLGIRDRKGSPETFDAAGFVSLVKQLQSAKDVVPIPGFDREHDQTVPAHDRVEPEHNILLLEGNYLFLNSSPWNELAVLFDLKIFTNPGIEELEKRLIQRWLENGHTLNQATKRAHSNDIPNAKTVLSSSCEPDLLISEPLPELQD